MVPPPTKRINPRTKRADDDLLKRCTDRNALALYMAPPNNDLSKETGKERTKRWQQIVVSLGAFEREQELAKKLIVEQ